MNDSSYHPRNTGKSRAGSRPPMFTEAQEARIYKLHVQDGLSMVQLARRFGSSAITIRKAIKNQKEREAMIKIQKLKRATKRSGYALPPGESSEVRGLVIVNNNSFTVYVDKWTRKRAKNK